MRLNYKRYFFKLNQNYLERYFYRLLRFAEKRFKFNNIYYVRQKAIYPKIYHSINAGFYSTVPYNAYQGQFWWIKRKYINRKYHFFIKLIKKKIKKFKIKHTAIFEYTTNFRFKLLWNFLNVYIFLFSIIHIDLLNLSKSLKSRRRRVFHFLIFSFTQARLFINLQNFFKKNYIFLSTGLFIKFFEKKKSIKKNKIIKLLMAKFLRKLFLITKIWNTIVIIKKTPLFFLEMINFFNSPIPYKFPDPTEERMIEETPTDHLWIKFSYFVFLKNYNFSNNRVKKKGRIKRKIFRKLILINKVID